MSFLPAQIIAWLISDQFQIALSSILKTLYILVKNFASIDYSYFAQVFQKISKLSK